MGVAAALHVILVGNPIHIDCDRNSHTAFVLIVMHIKDTQYFSQFDQILPSRDERNPQNNADGV